VPAISAESKDSRRLNAAQSLLKAENYAGAAPRLAEVRVPRDSPLAARVEAYKAQCAALGTDAKKAEAAPATLQALPGTVREGAGKGVMQHARRGYLQKVAKPEDAFCEYLRVDVLYPWDRYEHARALSHLARLYREVRKDGVRADACAALLASEKFAGI